MKKEVIFMAGILFLLVITGCGGFGKGKKAPITDVDVRKGIQGLNMEFLPNAPPVNIFEEGSFPISLKLKNAGAFNIEENKDTPEIEKGMLVFGFEKAYVDVIQNRFMELSPEELKAKRLDDLRKIVPEDFGMLSDEDLKKFSDEDKERYRRHLINLTLNFKRGSIFEIKGKSIFSPTGDEEFITVNAEAKRIGVQSETHPSTILAIACYPYKTVFGASACIDPDITGQSITGQRKGQKACIVKDLAFSEGQGAPVAITKIETRMLPQKNKIKPHFLIHIENVGNGEIVDISKVENACSSQPLEYKDFNALIVNAVLSGTPLDCSIDKKGAGKAEVRLRSKENLNLGKKEDIIRCSTADEGDILASTDAYATTLKIELDYGYTFTISKDIIIEKVLTY